MHDKVPLKCKLPEKWYKQNMLVFLSPIFIYTLSEMVHFLQEPMVSFGGGSAKWGYFGKSGGGGLKLGGHHGNLQLKNKKQSYRWWWWW